MTIEIYTDGSCKNNPGECGYAFTVYENDEKIYEEYKYLGMGTNNIGEWMAIYRTLKWLKDNDYNECKIFSDSNLVIKQITKEWKIKNANLKKIYNMCLKYNDLNVKYIWVKAHSNNEKNNYVDSLAKKSIEERVK